MDSSGTSIGFLVEYRIRPKVFNLDAMLSLAYGFYFSWSLFVSRAHCLCPTLIITGAICQRHGYEDRVRGLFHQMDQDMCGKVSWEEFEDALLNSHVEAYLSFIDLDTAHPQGILTILDVSNQEDVDIGELIEYVLF